MDDPVTNSFDAFGFLTTVDSPGDGLFGGYLVLSPTGRPMEFRCSTPLQPSRAQEILYGPTLGPYLVGEVIANALLESSETPVGLVLTDQVDALSAALVRDELLVAVARVEEDVRAGDRTQTLVGVDRHDAKSPSGANRRLIRFRDYSITLAWPTPDSTKAAEAAIENLCAHVELLEPFDRIRAALSEIQQSPNETGDEGGYGPAAA